MTEPLPPLRLHDTRTGDKRVFEPLTPGEVGMYSCGPTVYARQHLGNLRTYLFSDLLKRSLRFFGYRVRHVINITDVGHLTSDADEGEDKLERAARRAGGSTWEIAERFTRLFQADLVRLGIEMPDVFCRATEHITEQIAMIERLVEQGVTYELEDGLYFDTSKLALYDAFRTTGGGDDGEARAQARIAVASAKHSPSDFALWKRSLADGPRRQMEWDSPFGRGFPGWHIECSAMSVKYLGARFDIHTGGIDHVAVHHKNEIAQSQTALGVDPWVSYWLHGGWLLLRGDKMAKSSGGAPSLDEVVERGHAALSFRYLALGAHYRTQLEFSWDALAAADRSLRRLWTHVHALDDVAPAAVLGGAAQATLSRFAAALADDLNAPRALGALWSALRDRGLTAGERKALWQRMNQVFGLSPEPAQKERALPAAIQVLLDRRDVARVARDFALADALRVEIEAVGYSVEDGPDGSRARRR